MTILLPQLNWKQGVYYVPLVMLVFVFAGYQGECGFVHLRGSQLGGLEICLLFLTGTFALTYSFDDQTCLSRHGADHVARYLRFHHFHLAWISCVHQQDFCNC